MLSHVHGCQQDVSGYTIKWIDYMDAEIMKLSNVLPGIEGRWTLWSIRTSFPLVHNVGIAKSSTSGQSTDLRCRCSLGQVRLPIEKYLTEGYASPMDENSFVSDLKFRSTDITSISRGVSCPFQDRRLGISLPYTVLSRICMTTWYLRLHSLDWTICRSSRVERYASLNSLGMSEMSTSTNHEVFSHDRPVRLWWDAIVGHILVFCFVICLCEMIRVSKSWRRRILHKFQSETVGNYVL